MKFVSNIALTSLLMLSAFTVSVVAICDVSETEMSQSGKSKTTKPKDRAIRLASLLCILRSSINDYQDRLIDGRKIKITEVSASIKSTRGISGSAGLDFEIMKLGAKGTKSTTQTLTVKFPLNPPESVARFQPDPISSQISKAIREATREIIDSEKVGLPPGYTSVAEATYELAFALTRSAEGELKIVFFNIGASYEREDVHTLSVTFTVNP